jgi:preprotein translocase subunit SecD
MRSRQQDSWLKAARYLVGILILGVLLTVSTATSAQEISLRVVEAQVFRTHDAQPAIRVSLAADSRRRFSLFTKAHVGRTIEFSASEKPLMKARLMSQMLGGELQIVVGPQRGDIEELARRLISDKESFKARILDE